MSRHQLRLTGSGGQGVILATIIMAEAGYMDGKHVVQSQSYGPEARGGMCKAETIIDEQRINYSKIEIPTLLLSLTQMSFDKYVKKTKADTLIIVDNHIEVPERIKSRHEVLSLPILYSAKEVLDSPVVANIICIGAINEALQIASKDAMEQAVLGHIPKGSEATNLKALQLGADLVKEARG